MGLRSVPHAIVWPMNDPETADWASVARPGSRVGHRIEVHSSIGSTNDRARELLLDPEGGGVVVIAESQTEGRGRRGRTWVSPPGRNLIASVGLRPHVPASQAWRLGMAVALAAQDACTPLTATALKWPNDLVGPDGRKLGGILVETAVAGDRIASAVVGIGINVNWPASEMPPDLAETATSLSALAQHPVDRVALLEALLVSLSGRLERIEAGESPLDEYRRSCSTLGSLVEVETPSGRLDGLAIDLDPSGALVIETVDGPVAVTSGEVLRLRPAVVPA
jgi:BirA family transcriptional regulator, biotin operon repressor / biotin---[acetyl-CoA-carboxylase] ligase